MLRGDNTFSGYILNTVSPSEPHDKAPALIRSNCLSKPPSVSNVRSWLEEAYRACGGLSVFSYCTPLGLPTELYRVHPTPLVCLSYPGHYCFSFLREKGHENCPVIMVCLDFLWLCLGHSKAGCLHK